MGFPLMERVVYDQMAALDQRHWWYRARREVLAALIRRAAPPPPGARLLEIGCGTGHNLTMLAEFGAVDALELDDQARGVAEQRLGRPVMRAPLPALDGVAEGQYDLIGAFDVIEHIDDDGAAIASIAARLKPGGKLVMTVPAHAWMWSAHDVVNHHRRRYSKAELKRLIDGSPLKLEAKAFAPPAWRSKMSSPSPPSSVSAPPSVKNQSCELSESFPSPPIRTSVPPS